MSSKKKENMFINMYNRPLWETASDQHNLQCQVKQFQSDPGNFYPLYYNISLGTLLFKGTGPKKLRKETDFAVKLQSTGLSKATAEVTQRVFFFFFIVA